MSTPDPKIKKLNDPQNETKGEAELRESQQREREQDWMTQTTMVEGFDHSGAPTDEDRDTKHKKERQTSRRSARSSAHHLEDDDATIVELMKQLMGNNTNDDGLPGSAIAGDGGCRRMGAGGRAAAGRLYLPSSALGRLRPQQTPAVQNYPNELRQHVLDEPAYLKDHNVESAPEHLRNQLAKPEFAKKQVFMLRPSAYCREKERGEPDRFRSLEPIGGGLRPAYQPVKYQSGTTPYHILSLAVITDETTRTGRPSGRKIVLQARLAYDGQKLRVISYSDQETLKRFSLPSFMPIDVYRLLHLGKTWEADVSKEQNAIQVMIEDFFDKGFEVALSTENLKALESMEQQVRDGLSVTHFASDDAAPSAGAMCALDGTSYRILSETIRSHRLGGDPSSSSHKPGTRK